MFEHKWQQLFEIILISPNCATPSQTSWNVNWRAHGRIPHIRRVTDDVICLEKTNETVFLLIG
jgi:hypothetical protein